MRAKALLLWTCCCSHVKHEVNEPTLAPSHGTAVLPQVGVAKCLMFVRHRPTQPGRPSRRGNDKKKGKVRGKSRIRTRTHFCHPSHALVSHFMQDVQVRWSINSLFRIFRPMQCRSFINTAMPFHSTQYSTPCRVLQMSVTVRTTRTLGCHVLGCNHSSMLPRAVCESRSFLL